MSKTQELVTELQDVLDASPVTVDEKIKALGVARSHVTAGIRTYSSISHTGPVGTGKKTDQLRQTMAEIEAEATNTRRRRK